MVLWYGMENKEQTPDKILEEKSAQDEAEQLSASANTILKQEKANKTVHELIATNKALTNVFDEISSHVKKIKAQKLYFDGWTDYNEAIDEQIKQEEALQKLYQEAIQANDHTLAHYPPQQ